jgi:hypothetical protein
LKLGDNWQRFSSQKKVGIDQSNLGMTPSYNWEICEETQQY